MSSNILHKQLALKIILVLGACQRSYKIPAYNVKLFSTQSCLLIIYCTEILNFHLRIINLVLIPLQCKHVKQTQCFLISKGESSILNFDGCILIDHNVIIIILIMILTVKENKLNEPHV